MSERRKSSGFTVPDVVTLAIIMAMVVGIWFAGAEYIDSHVVPTDPTKESIDSARGLFGDKFGAINALFSGLAFAGIIFTIILQSREIHHTRSAFEEQTAVSNSQRFDVTFFQLLALHNDITSKLRLLHGSGRESFGVFNRFVLQEDPEFPAYKALQKLKRHEIRRIRDERAIPGDLKINLDDSDISNIEAAIEKGVAVLDNFLDENIEMQEARIKKAYTAAAAQQIDLFSHYFRNLYHTLRFIKQSELIPVESRPHYAKIIRSQLCEMELVALFYNSICKIELPGREQMELGYPKMGALLAEFDILQNMSPLSLIHPSHEQIFKKNNGVKNG